MAKLNDTDETKKQQNGKSNKVHVTDEDGGYVA